MCASSRDPDFHLPLQTREDCEMGTARYGAKERSSIPLEVDGLLRTGDGIRFAVFFVQGAEGVFIDCSVDDLCESIIARGREITG